MKKPNVLQVRLTAETHARLIAEAERCHLKVSTWVRQQIERWLAELTERPPITDLSKLPAKFPKPKRAEKRAVIADLPKAKSVSTVAQSLVRCPICFCPEGKMAKWCKDYQCRCHRKVA